MFLINSRSHLVTATHSCSQRKFDHNYGRTFSRSYGTILPSSFTRVLSSALVYSTCLPVSVCGTVFCYLMLRSFSWKLGINAFALSNRAPHHASGYMNPDLPGFTPYTLGPGQPSPGTSNLLRPSFAVTKSSGILT